MTLAEIIAKLEVATEGSRELDTAIWQWDVENVKPPSEEGLALGARRSNTIPEFPQSLDAALTPIPEGWPAIINWRDNLESSSSVGLHQFHLPCRRVPDAP